MVCKFNQIKLREIKIFYTGLFHIFCTIPLVIKVQQGTITEMKNCIGNVHMNYKKSAIKSKSIR